jgi:hypothetical protein
MEVIKDVVLLDREQPLSERYEEIADWVRRQGYEVSYQAGREDDTDWEITFNARTGSIVAIFTYHGETRHGLALTLVRNVRPA